MQVWEEEGRATRRRRRTTTSWKRSEAEPAPQFIERSTCLSMKSSPLSAWISNAAIVTWYLFSILVFFFLSMFLTLIELDR